MTRWLRTRLAAQDREAGLTLVEMLVAAAMSVVLVGAVGSMLISAVRTQPKLSQRAQNISTARWVLERMTREIRNGVTVYQANSSSVAFLASVRRTACGGAVETNPEKPAIRCRVTYSCSTTACARYETSPEVTPTGGGTTIVSGLESGNVFNWGQEASGTERITYIGVTLQIPNPEGDGNLTVSDGASLRTVGFTT